MKVINPGSKVRIRSLKSSFDGYYGSVSEKGKNESLVSVPFNGHTYNMRFQNHELEVIDNDNGSTQ